MTTPANDKPQDSAPARRNTALRVVILVVTLCVLAVCVANAVHVWRTPAPEVPLLTQIDWHYYRRMHPPTLRFVPAEGAVRYQCVLTWGEPNKHAFKQLESKTPEFDLAGVWNDLPTAAQFSDDKAFWPRAGAINVTVEALDAHDEVVAAKKFTFKRAAPFNGIHREAKLDYDASAEKAMTWVMDTGAKGSAARFPAMYANAFVRLFVTYARVHPDSPLTARAMAEAVRYGDFLIKNVSAPDAAYPNMPLSHDAAFLQINRSPYAATGLVLLYEATKDQKYLDAAMRIGDTLKQTQRPEGRWYFRVNPKTGAVLVDYTSDQVKAIILLDTLATKYGRSDLVAARDKAVRWMLESPVKTGLWQQQYDDIVEVPPYQNLEWNDTAWFIKYLLSKATPANGYVAVARKLVAYIEDLFVEWQSEAPGVDVVPNAKEQMKVWLAIDAHLAMFIRVCIAFHAATGEEIFLTKARAMANSLTAIQHKDGYYATWMRIRGPSDQQDLKTLSFHDIWVNCSANVAEMLLNLAAYERSLKAGTVPEPQTP